MYGCLDKLPLIFLTDRYFDDLLRCQSIPRIFEREEQARNVSRQFLLGILAAQRVRGFVDEVTVRIDEQGTSYTVDLEAPDDILIRVKGSALASVYYAGVRIATWHVRNKTMEIVEYDRNEILTMVDVEAAAKSYRKQLLIYPHEMCGVLLSARHAILYTRIRKKDEARWTKTVPVDFGDVSQK